MTDESTRSLSPEQLFYVSCREALRDGQVEGPENEFLRDLRLSLVISSDKARAIFDRAHKEFQQGQITPGGAMEPHRVYQNACRIAWRDGVVTDEETGLLLRLGDVLGLSDDERERMYVSAIPPHLRGEVDESPPWAAPLEAPPVPPPPPPPPPPEAAAPAPPGPAPAASADAPTDVAKTILGEIDAWQAEGLIAPFVADHLRQRYRTPEQQRAAGVLAQLREATGTPTPAPAPPGPAPAKAEPCVELHIGDPDEEVADGSVPEAGYSDVMGKPKGKDEDAGEVLHILATDVPPDPGPPAPSWELNSTTLLAVLGALCLGVGAIMLVAANWQRIPATVKVVLVLCSVASAYLGAYEAGLRNDRAPVTGYALVLLGSLLYAAGIALVAQVYHLNDHFPLGFLAWAVGVLPVAYVARSPLLLNAVVVVLGVWTLSEQASEARSLTWLAMVMPLQLRLVNPLFPFMVGGASYAGLRALGTWGTAWSAGFFVWMWLMAVPVKKTFSVSIQLTVTFGLLLMALSLWRSRHTSEDFGNSGYVLTLGGSFVYSFSGIADELCEGIAAQHTELGWAAVMVAWLLHLTCAGAWYVLMMGAKEEADRWVSKIGFGTALASAAIWLLWPLGKYPVSLGFNVLFVAVCLGGLRAGVFEGEPSKVTRFQWLLLAWVGSRWFEWFGSMGNAGLSLMIGGGFLIGVGFMIETWRKALQAQAKGES
jgi:hypothetical protein